MSHNAMYFTFYQSSPFLPKLQAIRHKLDQLELQLSTASDKETILLAELSNIEDSLSQLLNTLTIPPPSHYRTRSVTDDVFKGTYNEIMNQIDSLLQQKSPTENHEYQYKSKNNHSDEDQEKLVIFKQERRLNHESKPNISYESLVSDRSKLLDRMSEHVKRCSSRDILCVSYLKESKVFLQHQFMFCKDQYLWLSKMDSLVESCCAEGMFLNEQMEMVQKQIIRTSGERIVKGCVLGHIKA